MMATATPILCEFEYRPNRLKVAVLLLLALGGEALFVYFALYADRGAAARGMELTRDEFRLVMGVMAAVAPLGIAALASLLASSFGLPRRIAFTAHSILLPKPSRLGMSRQEIELRFAEIASVEVVAFIGRTKLLCMAHRSGIISIPSNMLANPRDFDEIRELLTAAIAE